MVMDEAKWGMPVYHNHIGLWTEENQGGLIRISGISVSPISMVCSHFIIQRSVIIQPEAHLTETP